jgi:hypothetical protein
MVKSFGPNDLKRRQASQYKVSNFFERPRATFEVFTEEKYWDLVRRAKARQASNINKQYSFSDATEKSLLMTHKSSTILNASSQNNMKLQAVQLRLQKMQKFIINYIAHVEKEAMKT